MKTISNKNFEMKKIMERLNRIMEDRKIRIGLNLLSGTIAGVSWAILDRVSSFWDMSRSGRQAAMLFLLLSAPVYLLSWYQLIKKEAGTLKRIDRIPYEFLVFASLLAVFFDMILFGSFFRYSIRSQYSRRICLAIGGTGILIVILVFTLSTVRRIRSRHFSEYTLVPSVNRRFGERISNIRNGFYERTTFVSRVTGFLIILFVIQVYFIWQANMRWLLVWFVVYKLMETFFLIRVIGQIERVRLGTQQIADGNIGNAISTKHMSRSFREYTENLNRIQDGVAAAVEQQTKSERMRTELITNVSHDIKTPLTSIINYVDLMDKEEIGEERVREYLEVLKRQSGKLKRLVEDLVEASRAATGNIEMHPELCSLTMILDQTIGEFADRLQERGLTLVYTPPVNDVYVYADGRYLWRVFDNLMSNVCKYSLSGTRVYLDCTQKNRVELKNISEKSLNIAADELMERFVRGDASRNTEGSGLGLSIAASLMNLMGGSLEISIDGDLFKAAVVMAMEKK